MSQNPAPSLYDALHVLPTASTEEVRRAWRALVQQHHPDRRGRAAGNEARIALINQAYEVLSDPHRRAEYDAARWPAAAVPVTPLRKPADLSRYTLEGLGRSRLPLRWVLPCLLLVVLGLGWLAWRLLPGTPGPASRSSATAAETLRLTPARQLNALPRRAASGSQASR
ncbi:J domain-containing protein [Ramlibacter tataouinensis]|uniref:J domain-containing protein n=1 Tax=Ramlibacter tataouinensis (strain ATCC BAA-407 / DSM 14655 / LMG 21543 / TTB310) TaxID=365046 RepID=F5Y663_RAMTT|nr:J domain-containing protein [Ramlibacter tataouinensis]AEG92749.1 hypothetical protein Rta_16570 [Ramlibacter tataouinensis TTB310]